MFDDLYILQYIQRAAAGHIQTKYFKARGDFKDIVARAKFYCENVGVRFVYCRPFLSNLDEEEKKHKAAY